MRVYTNIIYKYIYICIYALHVYVCMHASLTLVHTDTHACHFDEMPTTVFHRAVTVIQGFHVNSFSIGCNTCAIGISREPQVYSGCMVVDFLDEYC